MKVYKQELKTNITTKEEIIGRLKNNTIHSLEARIPITHMGIMVGYVHVEIYRPINGDEIDTNPRHIKTAIWSEFDPTRTTIKNGISNAKKALKNIENARELHEYKLVYF